MRALFYLYLKELREHRNLYVVLAAAAVMLYTFILAQVESEIGALFFAGLPVWISVALIPFALVQSFTREWKGSTHYFLLSLPVAPFIVAFAKWLSTLTVGVVIFVVSIAGIQLIAVDFPLSATVFQVMGATPKQILVYMNVQYLMTLILLLGVVMGAIGIRTALPQFKGLAVISFLLLTVYLYVKFLFPFANLVGSDLGAAWIPTAYSGGLGLIYTAFGLVLFDRTVEV